MLFRSKLTSLDGHLVLLENSPHRDLDQDPTGRTVRTPFEVHFEGYLPEATGKLLYGQNWDTWHWTPFRGQVVAAGSFRGRAITNTPKAAFVDEMRKWGVRHLLAWSPPTLRYLDADPAAFIRVWQHGLWVHYELAGSDARPVVTAVGVGMLEGLSPLGGQVRLSGMRQGDRVGVRMNYFPAWRAYLDDIEVPVYADHGQLAFDAPRDGDYNIELKYPPRRPLIAMSLLSFLVGSLAMCRTIKA